MYLKFKRKIILIASLMLCAPFLKAQTLVWTVTYNGSQNAWDESRLLYVDAAGSSYFGAYETSATGNDVAIFKYDNNGNQLWKASYNGGWSGIDWANAMTIDAAGNLYITGYITDPLGSGIIIKFNSAGVFQWRTFFSTTFSDEGAAIVTDGNFVYATCTDFVFVGHFNNDYLTVKLDCATGTVQAGWPQWYNSASNNFDTPTGIAIDAASNVYVTGYTTNGAGNKDYGTIAYTTGGAVIAGWPQTYNGAGNGDDVPAQILVSGANVVITGYSTGAGTNWDMCTIMYTTAGAAVAGWPQIYNGTGNGWDGTGNTNNKASFRPMTVDGAGNVYVCGWAVGAASSYDMVTFKYNSAGVVQAGWPQIYNGTTNGDDIGRGVALDGSGNVFVTGSTNGNANQNFVTIKYNSAGVTQAGWPVFYDSGFTDEALAISVVGACVWVTGNSSNGGVPDMLTAVYCDPILLPVELLSFTANYNSNINGVEIAWETATEINNNYFTVEKSSDGIIWDEVEKVRGAGNSDLPGKYKAVDKEPFAGISYYRLKQTDFNGKFSYSKVQEVNVEDNFNPVAYPNPCKGQFKLQIATAQLSLNNKNEVFVYDVLGNISFYTIINARQITDNPSSINISIDLGNDAKGIYFYKIISEEKVLLSGKIISQ